MKMSSEPTPTGAPPGAADQRRPHARRRSVLERIIHEVKQFVGMGVYLWACFGLFALHESMVLEQHHINYKFYGFAVVNSLILAKVMLVAEDLHLGERFQNGPLVFPILYKAFIFSIVFICFDVVEEVVVGMVKGKTLLASVPSIGGGTLGGVLSVGTIIFFALIPFFAFREIGRVVGERELHSLLFARGRQAEPGHDVAGPHSARR
jgi:hypothetical protein